MSVWSSDIWGHNDTDILVWSLWISLCNTGNVPLLLFASVFFPSVTFFHSLHELVKHNENGLIFRDSKELAEQLKVKALTDFFSPQK